MNKKIILFGSFLAVFLMLMIPNVSAIEYQQVKQAQENFLENRLKIVEEKFDNINYEDLKNKSRKDLINLGLKKIEEKLKNISIEKNLLNSKGIFKDPGNGTDGNGPDDLSDWFYLIIFSIMNFPITILNIIFQSNIISDILYIVFNIITSIINFFGNILISIINLIIPIINFLLQILQLIPGAIFILILAIIGFVGLFIIYSLKGIELIFRIIFKLYEIFSPIIESINELYTKAYQEAYDIVDWDGDGK